MGKTKQIGVRFNEEILENLKEDGLADSPQKALNFLSTFWNTNRQVDKIIGALEEVKEIEAVRVKQNKVAAKDVVEPKPGSMAYFFKYGK